VRFDEAAASVAASVLASPPTLRGGRLVCVDGPSGAGKTTLAATLVAAFEDALPPGGTVRVLHMDDVYDGWAGLDAGMATVATSVVAPLSAGEPGRYRRYDWHRMAFAEEVDVPPCDVLVVEGVGAGASAYDEAVTALVWLDAPPDVRLARGLARDGEAVRDRLLAWADQETAMFVRERTRSRADMVLDGQSGALRK
jgi:uridine kinase